MKNFLPILFVVTAVFSSGQFSFAQKKEKKGRFLNSSTSADTTKDDYYGDQTIRYEDYIYKKYIHTVQLRDESFELSHPILNLDSQEKLKLSFDDLDGDLKSYSYSIIHCNSNWEPSDMMSAEYIEGFSDNTINDYRYSFNTFVKYTHFNAVFPNNSTRITKTGNYILKVYLDGDPENIAITKRFVVYQSKVMITSRVTAATIIDDRNYKQEIDFTINHTGYQINNPYGDFHVVITQNNRWDNAIRGLKPVYVKDAELVYDYDQDNVFPGGNEFRFFDIKSIRYMSERLYKVRTDTSGNHVELYTDEKRTFKRFYSQSDINGDFLIKVQEGNNSEVEADYCYVKFFLPYDAVLTDGNLYVFGAFNSWRCNRENLMQYNSARFGYECTILMKQGYYNYEFAFLKDGESAADETLIEGTHYETENDYTIYVYHRQQGTFYDQLIGVKRLNSMKDF
ncbi:MAG: DUF5103 domain-containing protein [Bacteroidota bacterium]|nr:DUF5103 domain-containing protein [Bacteroidota bacterium]